MYMHLFDDTRNVWIRMDIKSDNGQRKIHLHLILQIQEWAEIPGVNVRIAESYVSKVEQTKVRIHLLLGC